MRNRVYQVMPDLSLEDFSALKADIDARGVLVPVEYDEADNILDGHHRVRACLELGIEWPRFVRKGMTEAEKRTHARQLNLARRHLNQSQKRDLIGEQLVETPAKSNRQVAAGLGVSPTTVGSIRDQMEADGMVSKMDTITGKDGVSQPARKPIRTVYVDPAPINQRQSHVQYNSGENEWYTPAVFIEAARAVLGGFDLDPASSEVANRTVKADRIFTAQDDGLAQEWPIGAIWLNPPYAQPLMGQFADRFAAEVQRGSTGIVLVNNATETAWFQTIAAACSAICFPKSRIRFLRPQGNPGAPLQGQAIIYCGVDVEAFTCEFGGFGLVVSHG